MKNELKIHEETPTLPMWPEATETRNLRCRVNSEETNILAKEQSEIIQQIARLEDAKKASGSEYKARIEEKQARGSRIAGIIITGETDREVKCEWYFECSGFDTHTGERIYHPEKKALVRLDTLEVIEVKDITNDERQMALPISEDEPT
jgi:hypothetical protein